MRTVPRTNATMVVVPTCGHRLHLRVTYRPKQDGHWLMDGTLLLDGVHLHARLCGSTR